MYALENGTGNEDSRVVREVIGILIIVKHIFAYKLANPLDKVLEKHLLFDKECYRDSIESEKRVFSQDSWCEGVCGHEGVYGRELFSTVNSRTMMLDSMKNAFEMLQNNLQR